MAESTINFDDGAAYERFMGRWSRAVGAIFLDWVAPPQGAHWLDVGCGTGVFTELIANTCAPASVTALDPSPQQVEYARRQPIAQRADFRVADAQELPLAAASFDVVASALVINFIPDRPRALAEMRRVARPGGTVAGYVWDFSNESGSNGPLMRGIRDVGIEPPEVPGTKDSTLQALRGLFERAGFEAIEVRSIDVINSFADFDDFWRSQTPAFSPVGKFIATLTEARRRQVMEAVRAGLPPRPDGTIAYSARANAVKARVPG